MDSRKEPTMKRAAFGLTEPGVAGDYSVSSGLNHQKINRAVRVSFSGGLLGLLFGSSRGTVDAVLYNQNADGWNLTVVIPDNPNLAIWIVRLALLVVTLGLWTISNGYIFVFEKAR